MEAPWILTPAARKSSITSSRSKCSRVRTCKIAALDWLVGSVNRTIIRTGILAFANASEALRPTGPAPTIKISVLLIYIDESGQAQWGNSHRITRQRKVTLQCKFERFSFLPVRQIINGRRIEVSKPRQFLCAGFHETSPAGT